jgi:hypothetical protein
MNSIAAIELARDIHIPDLGGLPPGFRVFFVRI